MLLLVAVILAVFSIICFGAGKKGFGLSAGLISVLVFIGAGVRAMIGLSDKNQSVAADFNKDYAIFVQSKSNNRHLFGGDQIMVLK